MMPLLRLETASGSLGYDPSLGMICDLRFQAQGRDIAPLHAAPWLGDAQVQADASLLPLERRLQGDFFCAPFASNDIEGGPAHGYSANSAWMTISTSADRGHFRLHRRVAGALLDYHVQLSPDAPLLYQTHVLTGGEGGLPVAHHPMVRAKGAARICTSPKLCAITPATPMEPNGRSALVYPQRATDLTQIAAAHGGPIDITQLPIAERHEDFVTLVENPANTLGWTAVLRDDEDDIVFFLKNPAVLPVTMLWFSNGGRDYMPWNGRHLGVLGVEDGCAPGLAGHKAAQLANSISAEGVPSCIALAAHQQHRIAHVIGAIPRPKGWTNITEITTSGSRLTLTDASGQSQSLPFLPAFLEQH